jgi:hypothetical protein
LYILFISEVKKDAVQVKMLQFWGKYCAAGFLNELFRPGKNDVTTALSFTFDVVMINR